MLAEAIVSFTAMFLLWGHIPAPTQRWIITHKGWFDFALHGTIIWMFFGTFEGLMQAETCAILISIALRVAAWKQRVMTRQPTAAETKTARSELRARAADVYTARYTQ